MAWTRDQVHLLRRLQKEVTGRVRSLRFFENVRMLQRQQGGGRADGAAAASAKSPAPLLAGRPEGLEETPVAELALLSCCGHMGRLDEVVAKANEQECVAPGCKAAVRPGCCLPCRDLGQENEKDRGSSVRATPSPAPAPRISPSSRSRLVFISSSSCPHLVLISPASRPHLVCISPASRAHLLRWAPSSPTWCG